MPIISFWNNSNRETGQTLSSVAVATMLAFAHNYKILEISTDFMDRTVEECFWDIAKTKKTTSMFVGKQPGMNEGVEGLTKVLESNRTGTNIVSNYAKAVLRDRLDILLSPTTKNVEDYARTSSYYPQIMTTASKEYNFVIVDVDKKMKPEHQEAILKNSDLIVITFKQGQSELDRILECKQNDPIFSQRNTMLLMGKYDKDSKYNLKNISRFLRDDVNAIPYNTLYGEAVSSGEVADFFYKFMRMENKTDPTAMFIQESRNTCEKILRKVKELQLKA